MSKANRKRVINEVDPAPEIAAPKTKGKRVKKTNKNAEPAPVIQEVEDIDIFEEIKGNNVNMKTLIEKLEEKAREYPDKTMDDLLVFVLKACGYSEAAIGVSVDEDLEIDAEDLMKKIYNINIKKNMNSFPLLVKKREFKRFKTNYGQFWNKLVQNSEQIVFKSRILTNLIRTINEFSNSKLRTIRYGAAETLSNIFTPVVELLVQTTDEKKRQELHKNNRIVAADKKEGEFEKTEEDLLHQIQRLGKLTDIVLKDFLKKRYEDVMPEIRVRILELLTLVVKKIPGLGADLSLIHIARDLLTTETEVQVIRVCLDFIDQLAQPYEGGPSTEVIAELKGMKKDLFDLCFNTNSSIASKAFRFVKAHISMLEFKQEEIRQLCHLVFYEEEGVATVAADFIDMMYFNGELLNEAGTSEEFAFLKNQEESREQLIELAKLYAQINTGELQEEKIEKFVKAFFRKTQVIFDFQGILGLVIEGELKKAGTSHANLSQKEKKVLLKFFLYSLKTCKSFITSSLPHEKSLKPFAEKALLHASDVLRYRAQQLITNLKLDEELLICLLPIFEETDMSGFFALENEDSYEAFLATLDSIFQMSKHPKVIECIVKLLDTLVNNINIQNDIHEIVKRACRTLLTDFKDNSEEYISDLQTDQRVDKETETIVNDTLMKLNKLSVYFVVEEMAEDPFVDKISTTLDTFFKKFPFPMDFIIHSINILFYVHLWKLRILLTKSDVTEGDLQDYFKMRENLFEKLTQSFNTKDLLKDFRIAETSISEETKNDLLRLQETSFTLIIETLCIVSSERFSRAQFLYYQPNHELLDAVQKYIITLDSIASNTGTKSQLFNSGSKKLVQGLQKSRYMMKEDEEESDEEKDDEDELEKEQDAEKKLEEEEDSKIRRRVVDQKEGEQIDERLHFACSLITKLFMQCPKILLTDFGGNLVTHFLKSPYESMESLAKVLLKRLKTQEVDEPDGHVKNNYWRLMDGVLLKLYQAGDLKKACEVARVASKLYFERFDKLDDRRKIIISEKYLKYLVNYVLFATSEPKYYDLMSVLILLTHKGYLDALNYKQLLAFFEIELKERGREHEKTERKSSQKKERPPQSRDEEENDDGEIRLTKARPENENEEAMEILDKKPEDEAEAGRQVQEKEKEPEGADKKEYLDRFRQHMCRITGLKYKKQGTRKSVKVVKKPTSPVRRSSRKIEKPSGGYAEDKEEEKQQEEDKQVEIKKADEGEGEEEEGKGKKKKAGRKPRKLDIGGSQPEKEVKEKKSKKRKNREYDENEKRDEKEQEEVKDMVKGKQRRKKTKKTVEA